MNSVKYPVAAPHSENRVSLCALLRSDTESGLTGEEAKKRLSEFGKNRIPGKKSLSPLSIFFSQFKNPMVVLLAIASGLSFFFMEWLDGIAILIVIFINAAIGFFMEYQAERSMEALKRLTGINAKVIRENKLREIPSEEIVPGDILFVEAGDMILADARICSAARFQADESALTGESVPVEKEEKSLEINTPLPERINMIYKGTFATRGNAKAIVTGMGMQTELGKIASLVQSAEQAATPLEKKLEGFSRKLIRITLVLVAVIFIGGILNGQKIIEMLQTAIALSVAAIPEGLPIVATLSLARGMLKMARHNVIVKKLSAVETLGGTNVICADKTGTLTENKIEVNTIFIPGEKIEVKVNPRNHVSNPYSGKASGKNSYELIKKISVLCNTAEIIFLDGKIKEVGDPLETALLKFAYSEGMDIESFRLRNPVVKEEPFSSETRIMATLHRSGSNYFVAAKGAVEELLKRCAWISEENKIKALNEPEKARWISESDKLAESGLRVIGMAYKQAPETFGSLTEELVFTGLAGMLDPPREEVYSAIRECKSAGIKIMMITGDHPATAKNIAIKLGLLDSGEESVIHGKEMQDYENLEKKEKERWANTKIFARVSPKQKLDLVRVLQEKKFVVAMTGDGINDAPALKKADIGIAMGQRGTQVAQEVADMILKDDSFSTIVIAVKQGRIIFDNIRKFVIYLLSCNMSELFVVSVAAVLNLHFQLFPLQILFINLVTDVLPALALGVTEGDEIIMKQPPRDSNEQILDRKRWVSLMTYAAVITVTTIGAVFFSHFTVHQSEEWNTKLCNNILFYTLIFSQLLHVLNMSAASKPAFWKTEVFRNRYVWYAIAICIFISVFSYLIEPVRNILSILEMSAGDWMISGGFALLSFLFNLGLKRTGLIF